jgi:xylan 1,4-beta-xylosidase
VNTSGTINMSHSIKRGTACAGLMIAMLACFWPARGSASEPGATREITIDGLSGVTPFPHFWEQTFGSGRAILSLRQSYRDDVRDVKAVTSFQYVRFHAILDDEVGVYGEDSDGHPVYNFSYVDQIYDGLLHAGVRPFVELDFMPRQLSAHPEVSYTGFWYKPNVDPPRDYDQWEELVRAFVRHLVDRYGVDEVAQWWFEVWNEPNIGTWHGNPKLATYFNLYDRAARAVKSVNPKLRIGGPATAYGAWIPQMIAHAIESGVPLDFISGHVYGGDNPKRVFGPGNTNAVSQDDMVCASTRQMKDEITESADPELPLMVTEFNAGFEDQHSYDSVYMGPFLARTISQCDGLAKMMSYWTFSDVFEEQGPVREPFHSGYGLIAAGGIFKPAYVAFELLHRLGAFRLEVPAPDLLVTRRDNGTLVLAAWNLVDPGTSGAPETMTLRFNHMHWPTQAEVLRLDAEHSDVSGAYKAMGSPQYPTPSQVKALREAAKLQAPEIHKILHGELQVRLLENELAIITVR